MKKKKDIIDLGEWITPQSWENIPLKMYQEIERYYADKENDFNAAEVLHILCDKSIDEVNQLPIQFTEKILESMSFLFTQPDVSKPSNKIEINKEIYQVNTFETLRTGEYVAADLSIKNDKHDYASLLAILCRKEGEKYDSEFEATKFQERKAMFEKQPVTKILPLVAFFLQLWTISEIPSRLCSEVSEKLDIIQKDIEDGRKNGELSALSTALLKRKLKKLKKSISHI